MNKKEIILFVLLLLLGLFFSFYRLNDIPFGLNNDAAWEGSAALDILKGNLADYFPYASYGWRGEGLFRLFVTFFTYFLGPIPLVIKLPSAIWGFLTLIPLYFLIRLLFKPQLAFLTTFLVATSGWHIVMSRSGWRCIGVSLFSLTAFYFWFKGIQNKKKMNFVLAGVFLGLSLYTYDAARILPFLFFFWLFFLAFSQKGFIKKYWRHLVWLGTFSLLITLPLIFYAQRNWDNFTSRANFLFIDKQIEKAGNLSPLWQNLKTSVLLFNYRANGNDFFVYQPLLDQPVSWFFPLGVFIALAYLLKRKDKNYLFMLLYMIFFLIPGLLSVPNGNRAMGALPVVYFFASLGILTIVQLFAQLARGIQKNTVFIVIMFLTLGTIVFSTYLNYLGPKRQELLGFYPETYVTLDFLKKIPNDRKYDWYFTDNYPRELLTFLLYQPGQIDPFAKNYTWLENSADVLFISAQPGRNLGFVMFDNYRNQSVVVELLRKYPQAQVVNLPYRNEEIFRPASVIITIENV